MSKADLFLLKLKAPTGESEQSKAARKNPKKRKGKSTKKRTK